MFHYYYYYLRNLYSVIFSKWIVLRRVTNESHILISCVFSLPLHRDLTITLFSSLTLAYRCMCNSNEPLIVIFTCLCICICVYMLVSSVWAFDCRRSNVMGVFTSCAFNIGDKQLTQPMLLYC